MSRSVVHDCASYTGSFLKCIYSQVRWVLFTNLVSLSFWLAACGGANTSPPPPPPPPPPGPITGSATYANNGASCSLTSNTTNTVKCPMLHPSGANNAIAVAFVYSTGVTSTISVDDGGDTFTKALTFTDVAHSENIDIWVACGGAGGRTFVTPTFTGGVPPSNVEAIWMEFYNVAASSCVDAPCSQGNSGSSTTVSTASCTPAATGEMFTQFVFSNSNSATAWTKGSQSNITWRMLFAHAVSVPGTGGSTSDSQAAQFGVLNSAAAFTPQLTTDAGAEGWITASIALKPASAGTPPPAGLRILAVQHMSMDATGTGTVTMRWPHVGNTPIVMFTSGGSYITTSNGAAVPTDSCGEVWNQPINSPFNTETQIFYVKNALPCDGTITFTMQGTAPSAATAMLLDGDGADTVNPICSNGTNNSIQTASGSQNGGGNLTGAPDITPCRTNGIVLGLININTGGAVSVTNTNGQSYNCAVTPFASPSTCDENNGWMRIFNGASLNSIPVTWTFTNAPSGINTWGAVAFQLQAAP